MLVYGGDLAQFYYWIEHYVRAARSLSLQSLLWYPWNFLGFPFLFNLEYGALNPIMLLAPIIGTANFINVYYLLSLVVAFIGSFLFVSSGLSLGVVAGIVSGLVFTFNGFTFPRIFAGHFNILTTYCWLPLALYAVTMFFRSKKSRFLFLWFITVYLQLTSGFINIFIFSIAIQAVWMIGSLFIHKKHVFNLIFNRKNLVITAFFAAIFLSIFTNFSQVIKESQRSLQVSYKFSSSYSLPTKNLITFLFPDKLGNPIYYNSRLYDLIYYGSFNYWELSGFVGLGTLFLVLISLLSRKKAVFFFLFLLILGLLLSLGENTAVFGKFFSIFSFYRYIRIPAQHLYIFIFAASVLAGYGVNTVLKFNKWIIIAPFILLSSLSIFTTGTTIFRNYFSGRTNINFLDDFGDEEVRLYGKSLHQEKIDPNRLRGINVIDGNSWKGVGTGFLSTQSSSEEPITFEVNVGKFGITEIVANLFPSSSWAKNTLLEYSVDRSIWTKLTDKNKTKRDKYELDLPFHALVFLPFKEKVYLRVSKSPENKNQQIGIDRIAIVSY